MSYQVVGQPAAKQRPAVVTAGVILLFVVALLVVVRGVLGVITVVGYGDAITSAMFSGVPVGGAGSISAIFTSIIYVLIAGGAVATAVLVGKGRNPARIVAWTMSGVLALCCGCQSIAGLFTSAIDTTGLPGADQGLQRALDSVPSWINVTDGISAIGLVLASIGVIVTLSVPAANEFFRTEEQVWVPPTWAGEPGYGFPPGAPQPYPQPPQVPQYPYPPAPPPYPPADPPEGQRPPSDQPPPLL